MPRDPLTVVLRVRRHACDEALRSLVEATQAEDRARASVEDIERRIAAEATAAMDPDRPDAAVEAYIRWLPVARRDRAAAETVLDARVAETGRRRAELSACRTALEAVETLHHERVVAMLKAREAALQRELDDRPPRQRLWPGVGRNAG